ncbi:primosomal replication protein N [Bordetella bronchialis]|uniref:Replication restart protein PriB n=1 Tax=Bordetella bronchialis TaxID=463025 RepID=A0A193FKP3_9BORD|nr:primosomal replication protein N [Bordetella bronchialis]ANN67808.1 primosomal replication protein N [Bordetella bronchialis]ANN72900.1 primosomal replication protein N [Bordetella bronchialis]
MNETALSAQVLEREPLRHTPAGIPVLEMLLEHASEVIEAGHPRRVELTIQAVAMGDLALMLADIQLGTSLQVQGFLAPVRQGAVKLKLHMQRVVRLPAGQDPLVA